MLKAATLPPSAPRQARIARVMVVEDNVINRRVLGAFLKKKVSGAGSPQRRWRAGNGNGIEC
jgi:CheY-like chemotaxis protein